MEYFISLNGQTLGPMPADRVLTYPVTLDTQVCTINDYTWKRLYEFPELRNLMADRQASRNAEAYVATSSKDRVVAGVLAILLGGLGAQYFYLGKTGAAFITILLSLISCGLWTTLMFVQGIYMLTLTPQEFERKYVYTSSSFPLF